MNITLVPYAGLCNRLNAILSGLYYLQLHPETNLSIYWHKWFHCNCRYKDLFKPLDKCYPPIQEIWLDTFDVKHTPGHKLNFGIPNKLRHLFFDFTFTSGMDYKEFDEMSKGHKNIYVLKDNAFFSCDLHNMRISDVFKPQDDIMHVINSLTSNWWGGVIGLHIRRTDNVEAIKGSPMSNFYAAIDREIILNPEVRFYVATDDKSVKDELKSRYGEKRIISPDFCLKRNSLQGMKDAVVDLWCLGKTQKIYGSAHSTYSTFAANLYNIELII